MPQSLPVPRPLSPPPFRPITEPPPAAAPQAPVATTATPQPISAERAVFLRSRRDVLSTQLNSARDRRNDIADQLRDGEVKDVDKKGLESQLKVLDDRMVQIETDLASNARELVNAPVRATSTSASPISRNRWSGTNPNLVPIFAFLLLMPFAVQLARRMFAPKHFRITRDGAADMSAITSRLERMEAHIDAVALEVERVGEGQRFLTQAMTDQGPGGNALPVGVPVFEGVVRGELAQPAETQPR